MWGARHRLDIGLPHGWCWPRLLDGMRKSVRLSGGIVLLDHRMMAVIGRDGVTTIHSFCYMLTLVQKACPAVRRDPVHQA